MIGQVRPHGKRRRLGSSLCRVARRCPTDESGRLTIETDEESCVEPRGPNARSKRQSARSQPLCNPACDQAGSDAEKALAVCAVSTETHGIKFVRG